MDQQQDSPAASSSAMVGFSTPIKPIPSKIYERLQNAPSRVAKSRQLFPNHQFRNESLSFADDAGVSQNDNDDVMDAIINTPPRKPFSPSMVEKLTFAPRPRRISSILQRSDSSSSLKQQKRRSHPITWAPKKKTIVRRSLQFSKLN